MVEGEILSNCFVFFLVSKGLLVVCLFVRCFYLLRVVVMVICVVFFMICVVCCLFSIIIWFIFIVGLMVKVDGL